jgi:hypothetical protein
MASTFAAILTAHLLGDFILQTQWMIERKRQIWVLTLHVIAVTAASYLLLGAFHWRILLVIFLTHLAMDAIKVYFFRDSLAPFLGYHFVHLAVLLGLAAF